jgi:uncharacterized protein
MDRIDGQTRKMNRTSGISLKFVLVAISVLLLVCDIWTGPSLLFAILYLVVIFLAAVYLESSFAYLIAALTAFAKTYGIYVDYPEGEPAITGIGLLVSNLAMHLAVCFLFTLYLEISRFINPRDNPLLALEHSQFHQLREFIYRPYLHGGWTLRQRIRSIEQHYRLLETRVPFLALPKDGSIELAQFQLGGTSARIVIDRPTWMRREGEIGLSLFYGVDRLYTAMFTLAEVDGQLVLLVGNLQGDRRDKKDLYKQLTKEMYGMRPRDFLVSVLQSLGQQMGCVEIWGISDGAHRSSHMFSRAKKIAIYDQIWLEHGGIKDDKSGFFRIPARINKRSDEDIPSHKRSQYRRRYEFLDSLESKMRMVEVRPKQA